MKILIDGYNLLKQVFSKKHIVDTEFKQCMTMLSRYARTKGHTILVIFDGGDMPWKYQEQMQTVLLVWVGIGNLADQYIIEILAGKKAQLLVSDDRELVVCAQNNAIPSIESLFFWEYVLQAKSEKSNNSLGHIMHMDYVDENDFDLFMDSISNAIPCKDECIQRDDVYKKKLSKVDKTLCNILKKL